MPLFRRSALGTLVLGAVVLMAFHLLPPLTFAESRSEESQDYDYAMLLDFIQMEDRKGPLVEFKQTSEEVDSNLSLENRRFISQNEALLGKIRTELHSDDLHWRLIDATKRLMVVPEKHPAYAALFESYCRTAVDYVLQETALPNPYRAIATLGGSLPAPPLPDGNGITAYLVHNIADVYTEEYAFFDAGNQDRNVRIKLDNRVYPGEIGSYTSYLVIGEGAQFSFERNPYTLWRNSAANPINVFIAPIEETLHIALRDATEKAIRARLAVFPRRHRRGCRRMDGRGGGRRRRHGQDYLAGTVRTRHGRRCGPGYCQGFCRTPRIRQVPVAGPGHRRRHRIGAATGHPVLSGIPAAIQIIAYAQETGHARRRRCQDGRNAG